MSTTFRAVTFAAIAGLTIGAATVARADVIQNFEVMWSGAAFGNTATADATLTIDEDLLPNPGSYQNASTLPPWLLGLTMTVSGASSGNGTFGLGDFTGVYWNTAGGTLDLTQQLVGQATASAPWGTPGGSGGDFNLFSGDGAPTGTFFFKMTTNSGQGDSMYVTSFDAVPEPASLALLGMGLAGLGVLRRRKAA